MKFIVEEEAEEPWEGEEEERDEGQTTIENSGNDDRNDSNLGRGLLVTPGMAWEEERQRIERGIQEDIEIKRKRSRDREQSLDKWFAGLPTKRGRS